MPADPADLLVDFLNTLDVEIPADVLDDETAWQDWASARALQPTELARSRSVRDALRALALHPLHEGVARPVVELPPAPMTLRLDPATGSLQLIGSPVGPDGLPDAIGSVLAAAAVLAAQDRLVRVKICPADDCRWAFYDHSRNTSRTWCAMRVCGNRAKSRAFRERQST